VTVPGVHRFGNFNQNAPGLPAPPTCVLVHEPPECPAPPVANPSPALTETMTLPAGTLYIPLNQGNKHWIQAVLGENPFLPFPYFYDQVTWSYSMLRGFSGDGSSPAAARRDVDEPRVRCKREPAGARRLVGVRVQHGLDVGARDGEPAPEPGSERLAWRSGVRLRGRALRHRRRTSRGTSIPLATLNADSAQWGTPIYGLPGYPVSRYALRLPKIGLYTGARRRRRTRPFTAAATGQCGSTAYCERCTTSA
jgi:hypothetical protein